MSDIAASIATVLAGETVMPIYVGVVPSTIDEAIGVRLNDGAAPTTFFGQQEVIQNPLLQIYLRSSTYPKGHDDAEAIRAKLNRYVDTDSGILGVIQVGSEMHLGRNDANLHEFQLNFRVLV